MNLQGACEGVQERNDPLVVVELLFWVAILLDVVKRLGPLGQANAMMEPPIAFMAVEWFMHKSLLSALLATNYFGTSLCALCLLAFTEHFLCIPNAQRQTTVL